MKGNTLLVGLAFLLAALSVGVTLLAYTYVQATRENNRSQFTVQFTVAQIEFRQNRHKALVATALDFARRNPAINPILQNIGAVPPPAAPQAPASTKPAGR
ncbi:MAG: hypothetical protein JNK85_13285 [Verrucomicrobiales bacterium]|nr:hypothetical protein [Verrucomicrobiales bacterium]